jgi:2-phosphoglycerate kinase
MRGIMVQSLVSRGVPFEVALETATRVRDHVAVRGEVFADELSKLVDDFLPDSADLEALPIGPDAPVPFVSDARGRKTPFSKGILALSLQGAGMDTSDAYDAARELETRLMREGSAEIGRDELRDRVAETIDRTHGPNAAQRYRVWRRAREDAKPIFLLISGSSGVGKTSIAVEIARRLEISRVIGTDSIRQIMRLMFSADLMPEIHCSTYDAHKVLDIEGELAGGAVITAFREQAQKICVGVQALLDRAVEENTSMLIEGVNLVPGLVDLEPYRTSAHVISLVVSTLDTESWSSRFDTREGQAAGRGAKRYLDHFDEIRQIQDHILHEADQQDLPIIDNVRMDDAVLSAIRSVIATLKKSMPLPVETESR